MPNRRKRLGIALALLLLAGASAVTLYPREPLLMEHATRVLDMRATDHAEGVNYGWLSDHELIYFRSGGTICRLDTRTGVSTDLPALHYVVARANGHLVSTCALTIVPNLTRSARPYGLVENVVTHPDCRKRGIATQVLRYALAIAWERNCYKVMLMTGSKQESTLRFYEKAGFVRGEKTGFVASPAP